MQFLKQSTSITIRIGPFVDEDDGKTPETGLTIGQALIRLSKNGGDFAQSNDSGGASHDEFGWYFLTLDATDTNALGTLEVAIHETAVGSLPVWREFMIVPSNVWDSLFGSDKLDVNVAEWLGTAVGAATAGVPNVNATELGGAAQSATDLKDFADEGYNPATNKITGVLLTDDVTTKTGYSLSVAGILAIWHQATSAIVTASTVGIKLKNWVLGTDNKALVSTDAQDVSGTFDVNAKTLNGSTPNNLAQSDILNDATTFAGGNIDASVASRATPAQVNTEVLDVMSIDTLTLPGQETPTETPTHRFALAMLYKAFLHKQHSDADGWDLYNAAGDTVQQKATLADDGTDFNRGPVVSGP